MALTTAYAAGLRVSEIVSLKVGDIDSDRMLLQVRHGKGAKDRTVMLSAQLLDILRTYWRLTRPTDWLFPGREDGPINVTLLHAACRSAAFRRCERLCSVLQLPATATIDRNAPYSTIWKTSRHFGKPLQPRGQA